MISKLFEMCKTRGGIWIWIAIKVKSRIWIRIIHNWSDLSVKRALRTLLTR
jgi:hypothetical protein